MTDRTTSAGSSGGDRRRASSHSRRGSGPDINDDGQRSRSRSSGRRRFEELDHSEQENSRSQHRRSRSGSTTRLKTHEEISRSDRAKNKKKDKKHNGIDATAADDDDEDDDEKEDDERGRSRRSSRRQSFEMSGRGSRQRKSQAATGDIENAYHLLTHKELCMEVEEEDLRHARQQNKNSKRALERSMHTARLASAAGDVYDVDPLPAYAMNVDHPEKLGKGRSHGGQQQLHDGCEEVFVEVLETGRFKRVVHQLDENGKRMYEDQSADRAPAVKEHSPQALRMLMVNTSVLVDSFFLFCEGILSGAAIFQLIIVYQIRDPTTFVSIYAPNALEIRRVFYFLTTLAFVGVCTKYHTESENNVLWATRKGRERTEVVLYVLFYFMALLFSLLAAPFADDMANTYSMRTSGTEALSGLSADVLTSARVAGIVPSAETNAWVIDLLAREGRRLEDWKLYVTLRVVFVQLGWLLLCRDLHRDLMRGRDRLDSLIDTRRALDFASAKAQYLCGSRLESLTRAQLQAVRKAQAHGIEEVDLQLKLR